jgi:hypothetical protein
MIGGTISIQNILLLSNFPLDQYGIFINPIYGCLASKSFTQLFYHLGKDLNDNNMLFNAINSLFTTNGSIIIEPSKKDILGDITPQQIGYIIAKLYILINTNTDTHSKSSKTTKQKKPIKTHETSKRQTTTATNLTTTATNLTTTATNLPTAATNLTTTATNLPTAATNLPTAATNLPTAATNLTTAATNLPTAAAATYQVPNITEKYEAVYKSFTKKIKINIDKLKKDINKHLVFHAIMAFLWIKHDAMTNICDFFTGMFHAIANFSKNKYTPDFNKELDTINENIELIQHNIKHNTVSKDPIILTIQTIFNEPLRIISYSQSYIAEQNIYFSDCFETTMRNLFNYLFFKIEIVC